ncbi:Atxe2 family lasso peptide isopeptidase [Luteimonas sp. XNQY3]|nr:Atxe2 family lasso peptide isopeptidase [Luteimonas sp. XNQY3]
MIAVSRRAALGQRGSALRSGVGHALLVGVLAGVAGLPTNAAAVSPRQLIEVTDLSDPVISPDGTRVAFRAIRASVDRNTHESAWYVQALDGVAPPRRIADGDVPLRGAAGAALPAKLVWARDGYWVYFRALVDGRVDVWRAAADGSRAEAVTLDAADVLDFELDIDGAMLRYSVGATRDAVRRLERAEYENGIRVDALVPLGQPLYRSGFLDGRPTTQRLGYWAERVPLLADASEQWKALDLATGATRDLPARDRQAGEALPAGHSRPSVVARDHDSGRLALLTPSAVLDGERQPRYAVLSAHLGGSRPLVRCTDPLCAERPFTGIQWRPGSDDVLATITDPARGLAQSIIRWNVRSGAVEPVATSDGLLNGGRREGSACGVSIEALVCVAAEAGRPPRLERIDLRSGERVVLFDPNAALAHGIAALVPARAMRWTDPDGNTFTGQLFPARMGQSGPPPLFVSYFRCAGFVRGGYGEEWPMAAMAARGISALCINAAPTRVDAVERYELGRSAVESVVELLASRGEIDRAQVGMGGLSFGTEVAMWTAMQSDVLSAVSITSPLLSPTYYLLGSLRGDHFVSGLHEVWQVGAPHETEARWRAISPVYNLDTIRAPILMQVPEQEYIKTLDYAIPLLRQRRAELHVFPDAPHVKFQPRHLLAAQTRNLDWFAFWLQGFEDQDPAKAPQYGHWRSMQQRAQAGAYGVDMAGKP